MILKCDKLESNLSAKNKLAQAVDTVRGIFSPQPALAFATA